MPFDIMNPTDYIAPPLRITIANKPAYARRQRSTTCPAVFAMKGRTNGMPWGGIAPVSAGARPDHDPLDRLAHAKGAGVIMRNPDRWLKV